MADKYGITIVLSSPYHPEGNGIAERDGQTLANAIKKSCAHEPRKWPLYVHSALLAVRTTTSRSTGYTPFFLVYGMHALFPFDVTDRTWFVLDWESVQSREDLLSLRMKQLARREDDIGSAVQHQERSRQRAVDDRMRAEAHRLRKSPLEPGTWVLLHETWLDNQHGNKNALRWAGPYVVHQHFPSGSYALRELDGTILAGSVAGSRLKVFHFRTDNQTMAAVAALPAPHLAATLSTYGPFPYTCGVLSSHATFEDSLKRSPDRLSLIDCRRQPFEELRVDWPAHFEWSGLYSAYR